MSKVTVLFWRDIPAQVIIGTGRAAAKRPLSARFEQAIDRAAMKSGARDSDAYLAEWRKAEVSEVMADPAKAAADLAAKIEADYDDARLKRLIGNDGWA